jgi:hypothetical protein
MRELAGRADFEAELRYVADRSAELIRTVLQREVSIDTVCLFSQSWWECRRIKDWVDTMGPPSELSHGSTWYVEVEQDIGDQPVRRVGVRGPDKSRPERGYGDYAAPDFKALVDRSSDLPGVAPITSASGKRLLEVTDPAFDVRGYITDAEKSRLHNDLKL